MADHRLIWARCNTERDMRAVAAIDTQLREDGDPYRIMATFPEGQVPSPIGKRNVRGFLNLYKPALALSVGETIDLDAVWECKQRGIPSLIVNGHAKMFSPPPLTWVPQRRRKVFSELSHVFVTNETTRNAAIKAGVRPERLSVAGTLSETGRILPYDENDRVDFAAALGTRPVWLAAAAHGTDAATLAKAHAEALRRTHRLLLIISPQDEDQILALRDAFVTQGLNVMLRSDNLEPKAQTEVFIADTPNELGLWHRIAPISFVCGSFGTGARAEPFTIAALGSAVVHGPVGGAWRNQFDALMAANACLPVTTPVMLGKAIAGLLSADKTAALAHAGWDVTTQGAAVLEDLMQKVRHLLEDEVQA